MVWIESITSRAGGAPLLERGQDVAHRGRRGELDRRVAEAEPARAQPHLVGRLLARDIGDALARAARSSPRPAAAGSTCRCPGSPPIRVAEPGDDAAADRAVELGDAGLQPLGQRDLGVEPDQLDRAPAGRQIVARRKGADDLRFPRPACSIRRSRRTGPASGSARTRRPGTRIAFWVSPSGRRCSGLRPRCRWPIRRQQA